MGGDDSIYFDNIVARSKTYALYVSVRGVCILVYVLCLVLTSTVFNSASD